MAGGRQAGRPGESLRHRGVRWQRDPAGGLSWWNAELDAWVRWRPGQDAPPRPPAWVSPGAVGPLRDPGQRKGWRSPFRLVPVALAAFILLVGVVQATRHHLPSAAAAETAAAHHLTGRCLVQAGTVGGLPRYEASSVACTSPRASVKVVAVLAAAGPPPPCPAGTMTVRIAYPDLTSPPRECVKLLRR